MRKTYALNSSGDEIDYLVQWDSGVVIYLSSELISDSTATYKVHFQSGNSATAYSIEATYVSDNLISVVVPDEVLQVPYKITGYVYYEGDTIQRTILMFTIGMVARAEPYFETTEEDDAGDTGTTDNDEYATYDTTELLDNRIRGKLYTYSSDVSTVKDYAFFFYTLLSTLTLPNATTIGDYAFSGCSALSAAELASVESIGKGVFTGCTALESLTLSGNTVCEILASTFDESGISMGNAYIYVPADLVDSYKAADVWSNYADYILAITE